jgi:hypothetical protein
MRAGKGGGAVYPLTAPSSRLAPKIKLICSYGGNYHLDQESRLVLYISKQEFDIAEEAQVTVTQQQQPRVGVLQAQCCTKRVLLGPMEAPDYIDNTIHICNYGGPATLRGLGVGGWVPAQF